MRSMVNTEKIKAPTKAELDKQNRWLERQNKELRDTYSKSEEMRRSMFSSMQSMARENEELRTKLRSMKKKPTKLAAKEVHNTNQKVTVIGYPKQSYWFKAAFHLTLGIAFGLSTLIVVAYWTLKLVDFITK